MRKDKKENDVWGKVGKNWSDERETKTETASCFAPHPFSAAQSGSLRRMLITAVEEPKANDEEGEKSDDDDDYRLVRRALKKGKSLAERKWVKEL